MLFIHGKHYYYYTCRHKKKHEIPYYFNDTDFNEAQQ